MGHLSIHNNIQQPESSSSHSRRATKSLIIPDGATSYNSEYTANTYEDVHRRILYIIVEYWGRTRPASPGPIKWREDMTTMDQCVLDLKEGCELAKTEWTTFCKSQRLAPRWLSQLSSRAFDTEETFGIWRWGLSLFDHVLRSLANAKEDVVPVTHTPGGVLTALENALLGAMRCTGNMNFHNLHLDECGNKGKGVREDYETVVKEAEKKFDVLFAKHILARMLVVTGLYDEDENDNQTGGSWVSRLAGTVSNWTPWGSSASITTTGGGGSHNNPTGLTAKSASLPDTTNDR